MWFRIESCDAGSESNKRPGKYLPNGFGPKRPRTQNETPGSEIGLGFINSQIERPEMIWMQVPNQHPQQIMRPQVHLGCTPSQEDLPARAQQEFPSLGLASLLTACHHIVKKELREELKRSVQKRKEAPGVVSAETNGLPGGTNLII